MSNLSKSKKELKLSSITGLDIKESSGDKLVLEGYIATNHIDKNDTLGGKELPDLLSDSALYKIADQINSTSQANKLTLHHNRDEVTVAGVMRNAIVKDTTDGHKGVWVEAEINKHHEDFTKIKDEVEMGALDGFSIEFVATDAYPELVEGREVRKINDIETYGAGLASRPINPNAQIVDYNYKEIMEVGKMKPDTKEEVKPVEEAPAVEPVVEKPAVEPSNDDSIESQPEADKAEEKPEEKEMKEFKAFQKSKAELATKEAITLQVKEAMKGMTPADAPMFQTGNQYAPEVKEAATIAVKSVQKMAKIYGEVKEALPMEVKESIGYVAKGDNRSHTEKCGIMLKEAAKLHTEMEKVQGPLKLGSLRNGFLEGKCSLINKDAGMENATSAGYATNNFEVKEGYFKALEVKADPFTTTTNQVSDASYYQAAAEVGDVYDPVIYNLLNDKTTFYGLLKKVDGSSYGYRYGFRARYSRSTVVGGAAEGAVAITPSSTGRVNLQQPFMYYYAAVRVTGPMIAAARGRNGIGDVFAAEVRDATLDLLRDINSNLLIGTEDGFDDGNESLGLPYLVEKGSSHTELYGLSRNTYKLEGNSEALSTENISKGQLRKMITACTAGDSSLQANNGGLYSSAQESDLIFVCHPLQKNKILALFDDAQRFNSVSARAGFEGMPTFDGIPIHADNQCTNSVIYSMDMQNTFLVVQVPPTLTNWGAQYNYDLESGFIKTYFNLVCTAPGNNCATTGLKTT